MQSVEERRTVRNSDGTTEETIIRQSANGQVAEDGSLAKELNGKEALDFLSGKEALDFVMSCIWPWR